MPTALPSSDPGPDPAETVREHFGGRGSILEPLIADRRDREGLLLVVTDSKPDVG